MYYVTVKIIIILFFAYYFESTYLCIYKIIKGVYVLFHKAFYF